MQTIGLHWVLLFQAIVFAFTEFRVVPTGPFLQTSKVPLDSSPAPRHIDLSLQVGVCKLNEQALHCLLQVIEILSRTGPRTDLCSTPLVIGLQAEYDPLKQLLSESSHTFFFNLYFFKLSCCPPF